MVKSLLGHSVTYKYVFTRCSVLNDLAEVEFVQVLVGELYVLGTRELL